VDVPGGAILARRILDELEKHPTHWHHSRKAASALESCSYVVLDTTTATRIVLLAIAFLDLRETRSVSGDRSKLLGEGICMVKGTVVGALMNLSIRLKEGGIPWPELLTHTLGRFVSDADPAIRAVLLRQLPYLQHLDSQLGWTLFECAMRKDGSGLWNEAERFLYYTYHSQFEMVKPWFDRLYCEGIGEDLEIWGRLSALAALTKQLDFSEVLAKLKTINSEAAWLGAGHVWTHPTNMQQHRDQCLTGLEAGLNVAGQHAVVVAREILNLFRVVAPLIAIPNELLRRAFSLLESETEAGRSDFYEIYAWLNAASLREPMHALETAEVYLNFVRNTKPNLYDHDNNLTQLLTRLFAQAEEQEEFDNGAMLQRVVALQDALLALGVNGMEGWLKAAERP